MSFFTENKDIRMVMVSRSYEISSDLNVYQVADYATEMGVDLLPDLTGSEFIEKIVDLTVELEPTENLLSITIYFEADEDYNPVPDSLSVIDDFMKNLEEDIRENLEEDEKN